MLSTVVWWTGRSVIHHADGCAPSPSGYARDAVSASPSAGEGLSSRLPAASAADNVGCEPPHPTESAEEVAVSGDGFVFWAGVTIAARFAPQLDPQLIGQSGAGRAPALRQAFRNRSLVRHVATGQNPNDSGVGDVGRFWDSRSFWDSFGTGRLVAVQV